MDYALKNDLYKKARNYINEGKIVKIWTGWDDPTDDGCSEIRDMVALKRVFKYCYRIGWPVIRVETGFGDYNEI